MVTGTTFIDHKIRAELDLSLQEYVVMDFLQACKEKNLIPQENTIQLMAVNYPDIESTIIRLGIKGFIQFGYPTDKWTMAFAKEKPKKSVKKGFTAPSLDEVKSYFKEKGYNEIGAKKAYDYYSVADWTDGRGNPVKNWKQKMLANWFKDEYKQTSQSTGITLETKVYNR